MGVTFVRGDIFLTQAQAIAISVSATGRLGVSPLATAVHDRYPVFSSECRKRARAGALVPGSAWVWKEGRPWLVGLVVRETAQGALKPRLLEAALLNLTQNWEREGLRSLALARLGDDAEWGTARAIVQHALERFALPVIVYEDYLPGRAIAMPAG